MAFAHTYKPGTPMKPILTPGFWNTIKGLFKTSVGRVTFNEELYASGKKSQSIAEEQRKRYSRDDIENFVDDYLAKQANAMVHDEE